jgi:hypothetical protein
VLSIPPPPFAHLRSLTDGVGLFEHALLTAPRPEHGYCTDDVGRALAVVAREPGASAWLRELGATYLGFLERAQRPDGRFHNRAVYPSGRFVDDLGSGDSNGRALFGLGCAARFFDGPLRVRALTCFARGAHAFASVSPRANAWAAIGAAELLADDPTHEPARSLADRATEKLVHRPSTPGWQWPECRLAYDNARIPEALIAAGAALADDARVERGLELLEWLVGVELGDDGFSFAPVRGWEPGEARPGFDQQPIEAGSTAEACGRAHDVTGDPRWVELAMLAAQWFLGANDSSTPVFDAVSGGCCDGLQARGRNENQGAESSLALISAFQQARTLQAAARSASSSLSVST